MLSSLRARLRTRPFSTAPLGNLVNEQQKPKSTQRGRPPPRTGTGVTGASDLTGLGKILDEQGNQQSLEQPRTKDRHVHLYKPFNAHGFIRPHDLTLDGRSWKERPFSRSAQVAPATREARKNDVFYQLGIDPLKFSLHNEIFSRFMSDMAMIHPRRITGLTMKSQRRVAKAIRRAKMMGTTPILSKPRRIVV